MLSSNAFLLVSYYIFVIKCCLNWHHIDLLRRFSSSSRREDPSPIYSRAIEPRGLDEAVIRSIPLIQYKTQQEGRTSGGSSKNSEFGERSFCECAICLNEFQENEKLRIVPNCSHVFHIDCIDIWLQNNANCPLCRTSISLTSTFQIEQLLNIRPSFSSPQHQNSHISGDEDFVVIELGHNDSDRGQNNDIELPITCPNITSPSPRKLLEQRVHKKGRKLHNKVTSMGDECIDIRAKDEQFSVQPIRRSFSMDSSGDKLFYIAIQEALQNTQVNEASSIEEFNVSGNGRAKRLFFSLGHGTRSRSSVQPVFLDP
ncbi:unnamed protein product [Lupinus luteus]|uniref:RING-type E3 ubiquitin transferase n=1 Tax=Lupinus luteus TaxID=3873 RepID=A0AAV1VSG0_LUPLU